MFLAAGVAVIAGGLHADVATARQKKDLAAGFQEIATKAGIDKHTPGVAVVSHTPMGIHWVETFGLADLKDGHPIGTGTVFEIASCSKPFTATAILILYDMGKLDIRDPVRKYIPELPPGNKDNPVRIAHLLHHTGGLPNYMAFENVKPKIKGTLVNEDFIPEFARQKDKFPPLFAPGDRNEYSNTGYIILATIIQRVSGQTYGEFMRDHIFALLKMTTTFVYENQQAPFKLPIQASKSVAVAYEKQAKKKTPEWTETWGCPPRRHEELLGVGDGGIWTCLEDMQKWDHAIRERALLKPLTWAKALTPSKTKDGKTNNYGFGWMLDFDGDKLVGFGHNGGWGGFSSWYWLDLAKDRTTILLSNKSGFKPEEFRDQMNTLLDKK